MTNKANWLTRHGHEVAVVTTDQRGRRPYFPLHPSIKTYDLGINYDETNSLSAGFKGFLRKALYYPLKQRRHRHRLKQLLKKLHANVVVCMFNNDVSFVYKLHDGSRKVLEIHFSKEKKLQYARHGLWRLADRWRTWREERIVRHYDRFVVLTHEDCKMWGDLSNITVIPNPRPFESSDLADLSQRRVLAVGRLDYQKGFDRLIDIWARVQGVQGWTLDIVGDGPLHDQLSDMIKKSGLTESVRLIGAVSDIRPYYLRSSIVAMTSRYEGLPMALLEAQVFGLPTIAFACHCGPRDVITDGIDGFLIPESDETLFAERLGQLMKSEKLRLSMGAEARKASERFSEERIMQQWERLLSFQP